MGLCDEGRMERGTFILREERFGALTTFPSYEILQLPPGFATVLRKDALS